MSLQVWLPLTKDLRNQGLSNITVTNNGATFNSVGKLGGCYSFNNSAIGIGATNITLGNTFSITCWIKINSYNSDWANAFKIYKDGYDYIGLCMNQTSASTKQLGFHIYKNNGSNTRTGAYDAYYMPLTVGTWYHLCFIVTPSEVKTYQNGINIRTGSITTTFPSVFNYSLSLGKSSLFGGLDCSMNDFRLYNHALSQMEVKELAKGLVLHYPLNRQGWGQNNLIVTNSMAPTSGTSGWSSAGTGWANSNVISSGASNGHAIRCTYSGTSQTSGGIHHPTGVDKTTLTTGAIYTLSARIRASKACIATFHNELMTTSNTINLTTDWKTYSYSCKIDNTRSYHSNIIYVRAADAVQNMWIECDWIKLEEGAKATPWGPNSAETLYTTMGLNSTTEYDCSGFCNNGTRSGTFTWTSDTPKYTVSTKFNGAEVIVVPFTCGSISEAVTVACWGYESNWNVSTAERLLGAATNSSGWCIGDYGSENTLFAFYANGGYNAATGFKQLSTGWHHFVITFDGLNLIYYVDGQQFSKKTFSTKQVATGNYNINIGRHYGGGYNFKGNMSDIRIYATALSADDVKSLYQNSAYIDSSGNVYGAVHSEV